MQVGKWGNSLALRLPAAVVEALHLKEGDDIEVHVIGQHAIEIGRKPDTLELLHKLRQYRGAMPADFKFNRLEANESA